MSFVVQGPDGLYSMVTEPPKGHHKERDGHSPTHQQQHRPPLVGSANYRTQKSQASVQVERFQTLALNQLFNANVLVQVHPLTDWLCLCHLILRQSRLEPPVDKTLTAVRSLTLDTRGVPIPRKNQVKMISSCPLPQADPEPGPEPGPGPLPGSSPKPSSNLNQDQMYSRITLPPERATRKEKKAGGGGAPPYNPPPHPQEPEYSLPFDNIAANVMAEIFKSSLAASADPVYDSIDEMQIRNVFGSSAAGSPGAKAEHIYDEPEGCSMAARSPPSLYDDPEEVRGDAWKVMATSTDPKGHEFPYNPRVDDYAVPKRHTRAATVTVDDAEEESEGEEPKDSAYNNLTVKMM